MSQDFKTVKVLDDRLCVTDEIAYAVIKGAQNNTVSRYPAIAKSTSQLVFNVQVPSEQTLIDRRVLIRNKWVIRLAGTAPSGGFMLNVGATDALAPFACSQGFSTVQSTINNNTININMQDVINALLRSNDQRELFAFNGTTPTAFDTYRSYADAILANNNPLGSYYNIADNDLAPRGSFPVRIIPAGGEGGKYTDSTGNPRNATGAPVARIVYVEFETAEPLMVSPWLFADPKSNSQAIYGVTNLNFTFNLASNANRVWRSANSFITSSIIQEVVDSELIFTFLTPHASDLMSARNVVPYYEVPRYITSLTIPAGASTQSSNTLQLNQVPDKLIIFVRPKLSDQTTNTPDYFLPIKNIKINWNNQSGLLSNATPYDLYRYSRKAGSNQTWLEFSGEAKGADGSALSGDGVVIPTTGSMLMLNMGEAVQITEDWYAPSSIGNFNLQFQLDVVNSTGLTAFELVLITLNSGVLVTERGSTSIFTAVLDKQTVLDASQKEAYAGSDVKRMVGGGFLDSLKSVASKVLPRALPVAKALLGQVDNKYAKAGADVLGALGYGMAGAGGSGGGRSGGKLKKYMA
jgi:hypothetical protein